MQCVATPEHLTADAAGAPLEPALDRLLNRQAGPVTLLLHGYKYCPFHQPSAADPTLRDPHRLIYAETPETTCDRIISWPGMLDRAGPTLGIGWPGMHTGHGTLNSIRGFAEVYARADSIARQVARLADRIATLDPDRRIDLIGHSLGGRIALASLPHMKLVEPGRILLWGAAERATIARMHIERGTGRTEIINIRARTNAPFDRMFEWAAPGQGPALGAAGPVDGVATLTLDDPRTEQALQARGLPLGATSRGRCHWSFYTRPGTGPLYAALLDQPGIWTADRIAALSDEPVPAQQTARNAVVSTLSALLPTNRMRGA